jgi:DNA topoisomerase VI subunit B
LEFFTEDELTLQTGHPPQLWPLALVKELIDNSLDAIEGATFAGATPQVTVSVTQPQEGPALLAVSDNGPGLPLDILKRSLDYSSRTSTKAYYVSPTRGKLGNALKCVWAAPYVVGNGFGAAEILTGGERHVLEVRMDRIGQELLIEPRTEPSDVKTGTQIVLHWPEGASLLQQPWPTTFYNDFDEGHDLPVGDDMPAVLDLLRSYAVFNPHAHLVLRGEVGCAEFVPTQPGWPKWSPAEPTSPHWYDRTRMVGLIAAMLARERSGAPGQTVREFVSQFRGLTGSAKQKEVTDAARLTGCPLQALAAGDAVDEDKAADLLAAMQQAAQPVRAKLLGKLGQGHLRDFLANHFDVVPATVRYRVQTGVAEGLPYVLEVAMAVKQDSAQARTIRSGVNWSPAIGRLFGELDGLLGEMRVDSFDPVVLLAHLACPLVTYTDKGKGRLCLSPPMQESLRTAVQAVAKSWKKAKRQADRQDRLSERQLEDLQRQQRQQVPSLKAAAYQIMAQAYEETSDHGHLPANARQIMYVARPLVLALTEGKCWKKSDYFTQTLLPGYCSSHPDQTADWDVVFDDRGHLTEPHTGHSLGLGTVAVRSYIGNWKTEVPCEFEAPDLDLRCPTRGPGNRFRFALFIEKEGFDALLDRAEIARRYDLAIMSTKGMSVTAARRLAEEFAENGVTILVLHDFDNSGFTILRTLQHDTPRYKFTHRPQVIDLGLRLADIQNLGLEREEVVYPRAKKDPRINLRSCGATKAERDFLVRRSPLGVWCGDRVELNAMRPAVFIEFVEHKLAQAGVVKVVPSAEVLAAAFNRAAQALSLRSLMQEHFRARSAQAVHAAPRGLAEEVARRLEGSNMSWDEVVAEIADEILGTE